MAVAMDGRSIPIRAAGDTGAGFTAGPNWFREMGTLAVGDAKSTTRTDNYPEIGLHYHNPVSGTLAMESTSRALELCDSGRERRNLTGQRNQAFGGPSGGTKGPVRGGPSRGRRDAGAPLSDREREILGMLATGESGAQIAERLVLSPETVRTHIRNAMSKLGASSRAQAVALAVQRQEIDAQGAGNPEHLTPLDRAEEVIHAHSR